MTDSPLKVGIIGGTGYTGMELLRLLAGHPHARATVITSRSQSGHPVSSLFPSLAGRCDLLFSDPDDGQLNQCDVVFSAAPNGVAMAYAPALINDGVKLIDLSADFRIRDVSIWEHWYALEHQCPELVAQAVYGLPEINRNAIVPATIVANPGCYPTAIQLGFLPALEAGLVDPGMLIADAKSGVSGAGRKAALGTAYAEISESFKAYATSGHRHLPEIVQGLNEVSKVPVDLVFTPHLVPMIRGIHATLYMRLTDAAMDLALEDIQQIYTDRYQNEPFVDIMDAGAHPDTRSVRGSNQCRIAVHRPGNGRTLVVLAVEDNLVKGAAGQAIQNMNLMCDLDETAGLTGIALVP